jgi:DNA-binding transcriptional ArsR family regulator
MRALSYSDTMGCDRTFATIRKSRYHLRYMRNPKPLDALMPKTRQEILAVTLIQADRPWYVSELARRMGVPPSSLQREVRSLTAAGILKTYRQGRMVYVQANTDSPLFPDLRSLLLKTAGLRDVLADALHPLDGKVRVAFVYGSMASGSEHSDSDIDLMLIGTLAPAELAMPLREARDMLGRDINPVVYSPAEFREKRAGGNPFLTRVLGRPRLYLVGNSHELDTIAD